MSKGERNRIKTRVRAAMAAQARARAASSAAARRTATARRRGPAPEPGARPRDGKRLHRLEPDPVAAPVVQRIFAEYLGGRGPARDRRRVSTRDGIPSPERARPGAQPPPQRRRRGRRPPCARSSRTPATPAARSGTGNAATRSSLDVDDVALGHETKLRWNDRADWIWSTEPTHERARGACDDFARVRRAAWRRREPARDAQASRHAAPVRCSRARCAAGSAAGGCRASGTTPARTTAAATPPSTRCQRRRTPRDRLPPRGRDRAASSTPGSRRCSTRRTLDETVRRSSPRRSGRPTPTRRRVEAARPEARQTATHGSRKYRAALDNRAPTRRSSLTGSPRCRASGSPPSERSQRAARRA